MRLDRSWIEEHIPHAGRMCLLDEVVEWDPAHVRCRSDTHRALDHPLRSHGRLGIAAGIEYAAQAMAVHGALNAGSAQSRPEGGFLAALRGVKMHVLRIDDVPGSLFCDAGLLAGDDATAVYEFELRSESAPLLSGRATVVFDAGGRLRR